MEIGNLNSRIKIVTRGSLTPDGIGGFNEGAKSTRDVWAKVRQMSQREQLTYGLEVGTASFEFTLRKNTAYDVTQVKSIQHIGLTCRVVSVVEIDNDFVKVLANVQTN